MANSKWTNGPVLEGDRPVEPVALCASRDPELFFPVGTSGPSLLQAEQAKAVCYHCPRRVRCLTQAYDQGLSFGVWGGYTEEERRKLTKTQALRRLGVEQAEVVVDVQAGSETPQRVGQPAYRG